MRKHKWDAGEKAVAANGTRVEVERLQRVSRRAYELYEQRGSEPGHDIEDWLEAERLVVEQDQHRKKEE